MDEDLNAIALAIKGLQSNPVKDYIFPVLSALVSALLGSWAAFYSVDRQEKNRIQISNIDTVNEIILVVSDARNNLIAIKENYWKTIDGHPIKRILAVPPMIMNEKRITIESVRLAFLVEDGSKVHISNFERLEYIDLLLKNYNQLLSIWSKRNEIIIPIFQQLMQFHGKDINLQTLNTIMNPGEVAQLSDMTEMALMLTDDLLVELSCFLESFPSIAKKHIESKVMKKYRKLLMISLPTVDMSPDAVEMLSFIKKLDFNQASSLHGCTVRELESRYKNIFVK